MNSPVKFLSAGFVTVILFLFQLTAFAQLERVTLVSVLHALEQRHQVSFTYLDEDIAGILVSPPTDSLELSKALEQLSSQTGLAFSRLNNRFIAIQKSLTSSTTLCGRLLDSETKEPVVGAVVQAGPKYVVSDETGSFRITLSGWDVPVSVRTLGYAPVDVLATDFTASPCRDLFLTLTTQWLPDGLQHQRPLRHPGSKPSALGWNEDVSGRALLWPDIGLQSSNHQKRSAHQERHNGRLRRGCFQHD